MSIIILQHSTHGHAGRLGATLRDHGFDVTTCRPDLHGVGGKPGALGLPKDLDNVHGLVVLGGPQNVTDIAKHAWMQHEAELIKAAHAKELPVVGICLGCQLIGHALGGEVAPREKPAVGFYPVGATTPGQTETILAGITWNNQTYFSCGQEVKTLPAGATLLQTSKHAKHAAFKVGVRTFAFQYHFECDQPLLEAISAHSKAEMGPAGVTEGELKVQTDQHYASYARLADRLCVNIATYCFPVTKKLSA
jgi:GMP synthase (glutamine-hydrolysing)